MIDRDIATELIRGLDNRITNGRLPEEKRRRMTNIRGLLKHAVAPIDDIHAKRIFDELVRQTQGYFAQTTAMRGEG